MGTFFQSKENAQKSDKWHVVDAAGIPLGRLATEVASLIRGKHKPEFTPHVDCGDMVVIVNADRVRLTGRKLDAKKYYHHTGYIGGIKEISARDQLAENPERVVAHAVNGMLPKGRLGRKLQKKLKVYAGSEHPHTAQLPESYEFRYTR